MRSSLVILTLLAAVASPLEAQRRCTKGIPCGNTCIAANRTCRVGTPSSSEPATKAPTPRPIFAPPSRTSEQQREDSALAAARRRAAARVDSTASAAPAAEPPVSDPKRAPFVGDATRRMFYRRGCAAAARIREDDLVVFFTEAEAKTAGYARSGAEGC